MISRKISFSRRKGEGAAETLLTRISPIKAPVPIKEIAISIGCQVRSSVLEDDLSGMAFIKDGQKFIIYNALHHPNRQRFTIAHELGHHLMDARMLASSVHVDKGVLRRDSFSAGGTDPIEIAANAFAASILMPSALLVQVCKQSIDLEDDQTLAKLAKYFGVSQTALSNRILNLSLD
jgi:Zn-dependent peptidase ImmA (M78 family)